MPRLLGLFASALFSSILVAGCASQQGSTGYCLDNSECPSGSCDLATRRCGITADRGYLSDAALDRKLDMMVVDMGEPDQSIIDMQLVDVALPDTALLDASTPDQTLVIVDAFVDQMVETDSALLDMVTPDAQTLDASASNTTVPDAQTMDTGSENVNADNTDIGSGSGSSD